MILPRHTGLGACDDPATCASLLTGAAVGPINPSIQFQMCLQKINMCNQGNSPLALASGVPCDPCNPASGCFDPSGAACEAEHGGGPTIGPTVYPPVYSPTPTPQVVYEGVPVPQPFTWAQVPAWAWGFGGLLLLFAAKGILGR